MKKISLVALTCFLFGVLFTDIISAYSSSSDVFIWFPIIMICFYAVFFIIWFLVAHWVYKDAQRRKAENAKLWGVLVFFGGILGVILWFVFRPPIGGKKPTSTRRCPNCGRIIPEDAKICPYCGKKFESFL